jgi:hypothetical protein
VTPLATARLRLLPVGSEELELLLLLLSVAAPPPVASSSLLPAELALLLELLLELLLGLLTRRRLLLQHCSRKQNKKLSCQLKNANHYKLCNVLTTVPV